MKHLAGALALAAAVVVSGCGGGDAPSAEGGSFRSMQKFTPVNETVQVDGPRASYQIAVTRDSLGRAVGYTLTDAGGRTTSIASAQALRFTDVTINLWIGNSVQGVAADDLKMLMELYVAFFNRVPDADGLAYWAGEVRSGRSVDDIADSFYAAAVQYAALTGYSASMSDADFVRVIYRNVLGRSGASAPPEADVQFWADRLATRQASKGGLIRTMLQSAHSFTGDATWGWVAQLLDNKVAVAYQFAVQQGLNYNSPEASITRTMDIAAAVTPQDTGPALAKIGLSDGSFNLARTVLSGVAAKGPLQEAAITAYALDASGNKGAVLATGRTAADGTGRFSLALLAPPTGPVLLEATGGSYASAYDGKTVASTAPVSCILRSVPETGTSGIAVTPLTEMATRLTRTLAAQGYPLDASARSAQQWVAWQYGMQSDPAAVIPRFDAASLAGDPEGAHLGLVLAALDALGKRLAPANPDAIFTALAADYADARFDGKSLGQPVALGSGALPAAAGDGEFLEAFAVTVSARSAGLRAGYLDAHFAAGTLAENYQARMIPVYVAQDLAANYRPLLSSPIPNATSFDASATGWSCSSGAPVAFQPDGSAQCGQGPHYTCYGADVVVDASGRTSCSDGGIPVFHAAEIPVYTAPAVAPFGAQDLQVYLARTVIGVPAAGTLPVFTASAVHPLTQAELDAMAANDRAVGEAYAARSAGIGIPNAAQVDWMMRINDAVMAAFAR